MIMIMYPFTMLKSIPSPSMSLPKHFIAEETALAALSAVHAARQDGEMPRIAAARPRLPKLEEWCLSGLGPVGVLDGFMIGFTTE